MAMHDEEVERYLAEFQLRPVRALEVSPQAKSVWPLWLVAAAVMMFVGGVSLWYLRQETNDTKYPPTAIQVSPATVLRPPDLSVIALTRLALEDREHFEAILADKSRTVLPSFEGKNSTLRVLAKE